MRSFAHPKWKGRLGVEASEQRVVLRRARAPGRGKRRETLCDIVAKAGWSVRSGHTLLANLVASGEVPLALTVYSYRIEQLKSAGAPVEWFGIRSGDRRPTAPASPGGRRIPTPRCCSTNT